MNLKFIKPQNLGSLLMKSSQSNSNLRSPGSYLVRSYLITTVKILTIYEDAIAKSRKTEFQKKKKKVATKNQKRLSSIGKTLKP